MIATVLSACLVIGVPDGDSLKVKCPKRDAMSVRIAEIDAPEVAHAAFHIEQQPWGIESKAALAGLCLGKHATLHVVTHDRYGRTVAQVTCRRIDAGKSQVRTGNAWVYMPLKGTTMPALQVVAKGRKLGLWSLPNPVPPSQWRNGIR